MAIQLIDQKWMRYVNAFCKDFICDTEEDVANLPECGASSSALVVATGNIYMVNASGQWVEFGSEG